MDGDQYIKTSKFSSRMRKYVFNAYYIDFLCRKGNLKEQLTKARIAHTVEYLNRYLLEQHDRMWKPGLSDDQKNKVILKLEEEMKNKDKRDVEDLLPILFNQTLVMLCTVFDTYLVGSMEVLTNTNPEILKILYKKKDITIPEMIDLADYQKIFKVVRGKTLKRFEFMGIKQKFEILTKLGLKEEIIFKLNKEMEAKYSDPFGFIMDIYKKRNDIVHKDILSIKTCQELFDINDFFSYFISKLGIDLSRHFNVLTDVLMILRSPDKAKDIDLGV